MKPSALNVLNRLRQGKATTHDLCQPEVGGIRFGARIKELRDLGYVIPEQRLPLPTRGSLYSLAGEPENTPEPAPRPDPLPVGVVTVRAHSRRVHPEPEVGAQLTIEDALVAA